MTEQRPAMNNLIRSQKLFGGGDRWAEKTVATIITQYSGEGKTGFPKV